MTRRRFSFCIKDDVKMDIIYTKSVSRFVQNLIELLEAVQELRDIGIKAVPEKENIRSNDPASELMPTVAVTIAADDLEVDSERQRWSFKRRFESRWINVGQTWCSKFSHKITYKSKKYIV